MHSSNEFGLPSNTLDTEGKHRKSSMSFDLNRYKRIKFNFFVFFKKRKEKFFVLQLDFEFHGKVSHLEVCLQNILQKPYLAPK